MLHLNPKSLAQTAPWPLERLRHLAPGELVGPALAAAGIGLWQLDLETGLATWDAVTGQILGFGLVPQVEPRPLPVHPDDRADVARRLALNVRGEGERDVEVRIVRPDGEIRWVRSTARAPEGLASEARWVGGIVSDITDRKGAELDLIESRRQLSTLIDNLPGIAYRCTVGTPWRMTYISEGVERLTGYGSAEVMALEGGWCALIHPDDGQAVEAEVASGIAGRRMFSMSYRILARDGSVRWVLERGCAAYDEAGEAKFLEGFIGDVTEQKQIEQSLLEAQHAAERAAERVRQVLENTGDCVYSLDPEWRFTYLNRRARAYFGAGARLGAPLLDVVPGSDDSVFRPVFQQAMTAGRPARLEGYLPSREAWYDLSVAPSEGGVTVFFRDITERKRTEEQVRWLANHDNLTQLPNRLLFQERLDALIAGGAAPGSFALLVVDVDEFKLVNDTLGHDAGDALLCTVADRLRAAARAGDLVARLGGDEFAIILHRVGGEGETEAAVERILAAMREPQVHAGKLLDCSASIGAALYPGPGTERADLLKQADMALYEAKASGRGNCKLFRPEMRGALQGRLSMIALARDALKNERIEPFYQPKVNLRTGAIDGFEALLRWRDPRRGVQRPDTIAAAFDDVALAAELTDRMVERVIADIGDWRGRGLAFGHVAINAAAAEFRRGDFAERLLERLAEAAIPPGLVQLEVTETVFLGRGADHVGRALRTLSSAGVKIALDDFGTGFASLSHLKQFPVDTIKIDRSFIRDIETDADARAIVRAVVNLAGSLEIAVVAEGIETETQHERLVAKGCDFGQGYFYSAAVPAGEAAALAAGEAFRHLVQR